MPTHLSHFHPKFLSLDETLIIHVGSYSYMYIQEIKRELARINSSDRSFLREILSECFKEEMI